MSSLATNRIDGAFSRKKNLLNIYFTAGFPKLEDTMRIAKALNDSGADIIEIGIPFSDPVADGPTIQQSNDIALKNGMSLKTLFVQLKDLRQSIDIPVLLMGYLNPVVQFGIEAFCKECENVGIDGLILPDLPADVYEREYRNVFESHGLHNIFLITPNTSEQRILAIDQSSDGFIYMVSSASITGAKSGIADEQIKYFERVQKMNLKNELMIGFGISDRDTYRTACRYASGAIIGSAFINLLKKSNNIEVDIAQFVKDIKQ